MAVLTMQQLTNAYFRRVEGGVPHTCEPCNRKSDLYITQYQITKAPQYLTITLARAGYVKKEDRIVKIEEKVFIPVWNRTNKMTELVKYNTIAIIIHAGYFVSSGHYFMFVKANSNPLTFQLLDDAPKGNRYSINENELYTLDQLLRLQESQKHYTPYMILYSKEKQLVTEIYSEKKEYEVGPLIKRFNIEEGKLLTNTTGRDFSMESIMVIKKQRFYEKHWPVLALQLHVMV